MGYSNSTIRQKKGICPRCGGRNIVPLIGKYCQQHYWEENRKKSVDKLNAKERGELPAVTILTDDMDIVFSKLIRLKEADENGYVTCFTCPTIRPWTEMQCGHFVKRGNMATRFSEKNCRPQCKACNEHKDGNEKIFAYRLEAEEPGLVAMLQEQAREAKGFDRDELKALVIDTTRRVKLLLKNVIYQ